jgi:hypothetical protein
MAQASTPAQPARDERDPKDTPFFKAGAEACRAGIPLKDSALRNLRPDCKEYAWFIAGYDSAGLAKSTRTRKES